MLIKGTNLTPAQRAEMLRVFTNRWTVENQPAFARHVWYAKPTTVPVTDDEWLAAHAFHFVKDGSRLHARRRSPAVPHYLAD